MLLRQLLCHATLEYVTYMVITALLLTITPVTPPTYVVVVITALSCHMSDVGG